MSGLFMQPNMAADSGMRRKDKIFGMHFFMFAHRSLNTWIRFLCPPYNTLAFIPAYPSQPSLYRNVYARRFRYYNAILVNKL